MGTWMFVCCECCMLYFVKKRSLRRANHSSRRLLWSVECLECDREALIMRKTWSTGGCCAIKKKSNLLTDWLTNVWSRTPFKFRRLRHFVESEGLLPRSQEPATHSAQIWMNQVHALQTNFIKSIFILYSNIRPGEGTSKNPNSNCRSI